jgi:arsenate reductase (glutaredoxin)
VVTLNDGRAVSNIGIAGHFKKMTITIYGIKNCDTMKKARAWLDGHGVAYGFHDYKTEGITREKLKRWSDGLGWETLLNRAGTTFRKLPDSDKEGLSERKALALMLAQPSMIKRPVLDLGGKLLVGFKPEIYAREVKPPARASRGKS